MTEAVNDRGFSLMETLVAAVVAVVGLFAVGAAILKGSTVHKVFGTELTRATIYSQDKMEKLLSLDFASCTQSSSSQPGSCNTTGITGNGWTQGLLAGGQTSPVQIACPSGTSAGYVDYLDATGTQLTAGGCAALTPSFSYVRQWQIADLPSFSGGPTLKQITVTVYALNSLGISTGPPAAVVTSVLSNPN
jgi:Tfp pilus assembly protein PilV